MLNSIRTFLVAVALCMTAVDVCGQQVTIDGNLTENFWTRAASGRLMPIEPGVAVEIGGEIRAIIAGRYLYLSARLPEPSGRVVARSIGVNPVWEGGGE